MKIGAIPLALIAGSLCSSISFAKAYDVAFDVRKAPVSPAKNRLRDTLPATASWRVGMEASLIPDFLVGSGELLYSDGSGDPSDDGSLTGSEWGQYLVNLGAFGKRGELGYGVDFYSVGDQYAGQFTSKYQQHKGQDGYAGWLSWHFEKLMLKARLTESWTNTLNDANPLYTVDRWYALESSYPLSASPFTEVSIGYGLGTRRRVDEAALTDTYQGPLQSLKANFHWVSPRVDFSGTLTHYGAQNTLEGNENTRKAAFLVENTLFPKNKVSLLSSYSYSMENQSGNLLKRTLDKQMSSLGLVYKPTELSGQLKLTTAYNNFRSNDASQYRDVIKVGAQMDWAIRRPLIGLLSKWTVNVRYKDITDYVNPDASTSDISVNLLWNVPLS